MAARGAVYGNLDCIMQCVSVDGVVPFIFDKLMHDSRDGNSAGKLHARADCGKLFVYNRLSA